jgi:hypothetical protein
VHKEYLISTRIMLQSFNFHNGRACFFEIIITEASELEWVSNFYLLELSGMVQSERLLSKARVCILLAIKVSHCEPDYHTVDQLGKSS